MFIGYLVEKLHCWCWCVVVVVGLPLVICLHIDKADSYIEGNFSTAGCRGLYTLAVQVTGQWKRKPVMSGKASYQPERSRLTRTTKELALIIEKGPPSKASVLTDRLYRGARSLPCWMAFSFGSRAPYWQPSAAAPCEICCRPLLGATRKAQSLVGRHSLCLRFTNSMVSV